MISCRGKNGWFNLVKASAYKLGEEMAVSIGSIKPWHDVSPIYMQGSKSEIVALLGSLKAMAEGGHLCGMFELRSAEKPTGTKCSGGSNPQLCTFCNRKIEEEGLADEASSHLLKALEKLEAFFSEALEGGQIQFNEDLAPVAWGIIECSRAAIADAREDERQYQAIIDNLENTIEEFAEIAKRALVATRYSMDPNNLEASISDLMADLLHLARLNNVDPEYVVENAQKHFGAEVEKKKETAHHV